MGIEQRLTKDNYAFSPFYDEIFFWGQKNLEAIREKCRGVKSVVYDLGGGTGALSEHLVKNGYSVILVDRSKAMIQRALQRKENLSASHQPRFSIIRSDIKNFPVEAKSDCVFMLGGPISFSKDKKGALERLVNIRKVLNPNGRLYLDHFSLEYWEGLRNWNTNQWGLWTLDRSNAKDLKTFLKTFKARRAGEVVFDYAVLKGRTSQVGRSRLYLPSVKDWRILFEEAGFQILSQFISWTDPTPNNLATANLITYELRSH